MQLSKEVQTFSSDCERLLSDIAMHRPLTEEEVLLIGYYCNEILMKIQPSLDQSRFDRSFLGIS